MGSRAIYGFGCMGSWVKLVLCHFTSGRAECHRTNPTRCGLHAPNFRDLKVSQNWPKSSSGEVVILVSIGTISFRLLISI